VKRPTLLDLRGNRSHTLLLNPRICELAGQRFESLQPPLS
jgi:hypothetical protein